MRDALQLGARVSSTSAIWRAGAGALTLNSKAILDGVGLSLGIYLPLMLGILFVYRFFDRSRDGQRPARSRRLEILFVAWTVPALLTFVLIHIGELAYVLYFLPAMLLPAGLVLDKAAQALTARRSSLQVPARSILLCACAAANIGTFALPSGSLLDQLRNRDTHVSALLAAVHRFSPASTVLITDPEGPSSYRTAMYYLSNYAVIAVGRDRSGHAGEMFSNRPGAPAYDLSRFERAGPLRLPSGMRALILDRAVLHSIADPWTLHAIRPSGDRRTLIYIVSLDPSDPPLALGRWIYVRASDADPYPWIDATQRRGGTALAASGYVEPTAL